MGGGSFALLPGNAPIPVILVGAGLMGRVWIRTLATAPEVELVGLVDLDTALATEALTEAGLQSVVVGASVTEVAAATGARAVVNVTVPVAHHPVNTEALFAGLPVLCEKPIAPTVSQALSLAATAEASGQLLMTSQSRRYYRSLTAFRDQVAALGTLGIATTQFFKGPRFGGFRETMAHPLLVDMAIHAFDVSRYLLAVDPVSVYCESFNPPWSWFEGDAGVTATFEFAGGLRYIYVGSWASGGLETSWNGEWRVSGSAGTATWDGESMPSTGLVSPDGEGQISLLGNRLDVESSVAEEIGGSLAEFVTSLRSGVAPSTEVHSNVFTLAMVEAAVTSSVSGSRVQIADVIENAYADALAAETRDDVREVLTSWGSGVAGLTQNG